MTRANVEGVVGVDRMPAKTKRLAGLHATYADQFTVMLDPGDLNATGWARRILEETPSGRGAPSFWRLIGIRLGPRPSSDHIQGWRLVSADPGAVVLEARTPYLKARAVIEVEPTDLALALLVQYDHPVAAVLWPPIGVVHRRGVPQMLREAVGLDSRPTEASLDASRREGNDL